MRINLKAGQEAPPPEFRKQGHHMLEIIAAQIKEMEDAEGAYDFLFAFSYFNST